MDRSQGRVHDVFIALSIPSDAGWHDAWNKNKYPEISEGLPYVEGERDSYYLELLSATPLAIIRHRPDIHRTVNAFAEFGDVLQAMRKDSPEVRDMV